MAKQEENPSPQAPQQPQPAQQVDSKANSKEVLDALRNRLGIERTIRDELKDQLKDLQSSLKVIEKQNAKLETASRDTINIKSINSELLKVRQEQYVTDNKIAAAQKEMGDGYKKSLELIQQHNKVVEDRKKQEDIYQASVATRVQAESKLTAQQKNDALEYYTQQQALNKQIAEAKKSESDITAQVEQKRIESIKSATMSAQQDIAEAEQIHASKKQKLADESAGHAKMISSLEEQLSDSSITEYQKKQLTAQKAVFENKLSLAQEESARLDTSLKKQLDVIEAVKENSISSADAVALAENQAREQNLKAAEEELNNITKKAELQQTAAQKDYLQSLNKSELEKKALEDAKAKEENSTKSLSNEDLKLAALLKQKEIQDVQNQQLQTKKKFEEDVQNNLGITGKLAQTFAEKLGLGESVYSAMTERARQLAEENEKNGKKMGLLATRYEVLKAAGKQMVENVKDMWKDPVARVAIIVAAGKVIAAGMNKIGDGAAAAGNKLKSMSADSASVFSDLAKPALDLISKIPYVGGLIAGIAGGLLAVVDMVTGMNDALIKTGRTLGMTYEQVKGLNESFQNYSVASGSIYNTSKKLLEVYAETSKQLGIVTDFRAQDLETSIKLRDFAGLDVATRTKIMTLTKTTGKDAESITKSIVGQVAALKTSTGIQLNQQQVMTEVTKLSGVLGLEFSKFPEKVTAAYVQLKAMGMELSTMEQKADGFLDFQGSIQKEFEAQLMTGKEINLSKVRELVLNNKIAEAGVLIAKQVGSSKEFLKMNRVEQQTYAASLEMSRDEMANMLREQEQMAAFGATTTDEVKKQVELLRQQKNEQEAIAKLGSKEAYDAMTKATLQEKIAAFIEKIKQSLADFVERTGLIEKIEKMFEFLEDPSAIRSIIMTIRDTFATIVEMMLSVVAGIMKALNSIGSVSDEEYLKFLRSKSEAPDRIRAMGSESLTQSVQKTEEKQADYVTKKEFGVGGYTGDGPATKPAGIVHKGEYVLNSETTKAVGGPSGVREMVANRSIDNRPKENESGIREMAVRQMVASKPVPTPASEPAPNIKQILEGIKGAMDKNVIVNLHLDGKQIASVTSDTFQKSPYRASTISPLFLEGA